MFLDRSIIPLNKPYQWCKWNLWWMEDKSLHIWLQWACLWHLGASNFSFLFGEFPCTYQPYWWFKREFQEAVWISYAHRLTSPPEFFSFWYWFLIDSQDICQKGTCHLTVLPFASAASSQMHILQRIIDLQLFQHRLAKYLTFVDHVFQSCKTFISFLGKPRFFNDLSLAIELQLHSLSGLMILPQGLLKFSRLRDFDLESKITRLLVSRYLKKAAH